MTTAIAQMTLKKAYFAQLYANGIDPEIMVSLYGSQRMQSMKLNAPETIQFGQLMLFASAMGATPFELYQEFGVGREALSEAEVHVLELLDEFINLNRPSYDQTLGKIRDYAAAAYAQASKEKAVSAANTTG